MTDKQIIVDVTQCPYYREGKFCVYLSYKTKCEGNCIWTSYKEMEEQLEAKEQECEELKNFHINLVGVKECEIKELLKLKQTLTEIKEIVQFGFRPYKVCGEHNNCCDVLNEIWNKISECEEENGN